MVVFGACVGRYIEPTAAVLTVLCFAKQAFCGVSSCRAMSLLFFRAAVTVHLATSFHEAAARCFSRILSCSIESRQAEVRLQPSSAESQQLVGTGLQACRRREQFR
jgi:hypothetical protein